MATSSTRLNALSAATRSGSYLTKKAFESLRRLHRTRIGTILIRCLPIAFKHATKRTVLRLAPQDEGYVLASVGPHRLWLPNNSVPFVQTFVEDRYEPLATALFKRSLGEGKVVLDVGANVGYFTLLAANAVGARGHVFAFEPAPGNVRMLKRNVEMNQYENVSCLALAVGECAGMRELTLSVFPDCNGFNQSPICSSIGSVSVECVALDDFLEGRKPDVVKIDVEGAEVSVLKGMQETLQRNNDIRLFIELNPVCLEAAGHSASELVASLKESGFSIQLINETTGELRQLDERLEGIPVDDPLYYANLFCSKP